MLGLLTGGLQSLIGGYQAIKGGINAKKAQAELEGLQTPTTTSNAAVDAYYNKASASPFDTLMYQMQRNNANLATASGVSALQDRHSALAGVNGLVGRQNDAMLRASAQAQQQQNAMLGNATRMKAADDDRVFGINKMLPYQKKFSLLGAKAAGANKMANSGWSNMFGGFKTAAQDLTGGDTSGFLPQ